MSEKETLGGPMHPEHWVPQKYKSQEVGAVANMGDRYGDGQDFGNRFRDSAGNFLGAFFLPILHPNKARTPKHLFYHYTSFEVFSAILESRKLRMYSHQFKNDPEEVKYGINMLCALVANELDHEIFDPDGQRDYLFEVLAKTDLYFTSFSQHGSQLSQWRSYAGKGGVSIGFPFEIFECAVDHFDTVLMGVIYDQAKQITFLKPFVEFFLNALMNGRFEKKIFQVPRSAMYHLFLACLRLKSPAHEEEREVRIVSTGSWRKLCIDINRNDRRYVEFELDQALWSSSGVDYAIHQVICAPSQSPYEDVIRIAKLLRKNNVGFARVDHSNVSYRWP